MIRLKLTCPRCKVSAISWLSVFISDIIGKDVRCSICSGYYGHRSWVKKLLLLYLFVGVMVAYASSYNPAAHCYEASRFFIVTTIVILIGFGMIGLVPLTEKDSDTVALHGCFRAFLWCIWIGFLIAIAGFKLLSVLQNKSFEVDFLRVHLSFGNLFFYFAITLWVTWEIFIQELQKFIDKK